MMGILRRILGIKIEADPELAARAEEADKVIQRERQEYRQTVQRVASGTRNLMMSWDEVNHMINGTGRNGKPST